MAPRRNKEPGSWEVDADKPKPEGETRVRRSYCVKDLQRQPVEGIDTIYDVTCYAARTHPNKNAFGTRPIVKTHTEVKQVKKVVGGKEVTEDKEWKFFELGPYEWVTAGQWLDMVTDMSSGLMELGLGKTGEGEDGSRFCSIFAATSMNWQLVAQSCARISTPICTAYDTLGPKGLSLSLAETKAKCIFTNADLLKVVAAVLVDLPDLDTIIYDGEPDSKLMEKIKSIRPITVISLEEVSTLGKQKPHEAIPPKREEVFCIMYTSGSMGDPKGVQLTHGNLISSVGGVWKLLYDVFLDTDSYLAFLPLAHILEFIVEISWLFVGMPIGYGRVKTLTDASVRNCKGDIAEMKPSIMCGVPAVWELIRKGVNAKVASGSSLKQSIFSAALSGKQWAESSPHNPLAGVTAAFADSLVFNQVKRQTGGRLRYVLSGGAAISRDTQKFMTASICNVLQGYGLTETCGMTAVLHPSFFSYGPSGCIVPSMEVKLVDAPELGYLSTNQDPQGEIYLRGNSLTIGYYKRDELNRESFTVDGWFKTGDVGQFNQDGTLSIIDRIKNLVKLSGGEYIALEKLEAIYKSCALVGNLCVMASSDAKQPIAVLIPHEANFSKYLSGNSSFPQSTEEACRSPEVRAAVLKELNKTGKGQGLNSMESLLNIVLTPDEWTPQNGMVTAAQKINRKGISTQYKTEIDAAYRG